MTPAALTPEEFAAVTGFRVETVRRWCRLGFVKATRFGRSWRIAATEVPPEFRPPTDPGETLAARADRAARARRALLAG